MSVTTQRKGTAPRQSKSMKAMASIRRAYTLVELLTVIAITAVILTIIVLPIIQTFNLTRAAQAFADAQDRARGVMEKVQRDIGNAASVRENDGLKGAINIAVPGGPGSSSALVAVALGSCKLDLLMPAQEGAIGPSGAYRNPGQPILDASGNIIGYKEDPTIQAPRGTIATPSATGVTLVRWWIGLRDPFAPYNNPYQVWSTDPTFGGVLQPRGSGKDNLYVLYRAEVALSVPRNIGGNIRFVPNTDFFDVDPQGRLIIDDPDFFRPNGDLTLGAIVTNDARARRIRNWKSKAVIQTELSRYDLITPVFDKASKRTVFDLLPGGIVSPRLQPLIQFRPERLSEGSAEGQQVVRFGAEQDNAVIAGPEVFRTKLAGWQNSVVRVLPIFNRANPAWTSADPYAILRRRTPGGPYSLYAITSAGTVDDLVAGTELWDHDAFERALSTPNVSAYAFSYALQQANARSGWLASKATFEDVFIPFLADGNLGRVTASFSSEMVGNPATLVAPLGGNSPTAATGLELTPSSDAASQGATPFSDPLFASINRKFNRLWNQFPTMRPDVHRFIDLRVLPQQDGTISPLDPTNGFSRASIVPGSEEVYGPDQKSGPNYGKPVRYTRTTNANPGPNEYRINYVDQVEPNYANPGLGLPPTEVAGFNPAVYDPTNFVSAVYQPRFKAGYIQLNSDPNVPLPALYADGTPGTIKVVYKFQFTKAIARPSQPSGVGLTDTVNVEYDSRQIMRVLVTIKNFPQSNLPNGQTVTLSGEAPVRNYLR